MSGLLKGVRVVELSTWGFVPTAGVVLADWGADVIKVEHPEFGDPARGVVTSTWRAGKNGVSITFEYFNRGKRCVGIDLKSEAGREVLFRLLADADVFVTNLRRGARRKMGIDAEQVRARFPRLVYASGSGMGSEGPDGEQGGYDLSAYWSRAGVVYCVTPPGSPRPNDMPSPGFGDIPSGTMLAGGIAAALYQQAKTGEGATLDLSLLNAGMWALTGEITGADAVDAERFYKGDGRNSGNPLVTVYRTKDDRFLQLVMTEGDKHFADLCRRVDRPTLADDPRFVDQSARTQNAAACIEILERIFAERTLEEWRDVLQDATGVWAAVQKPREVPLDPQVIANGYVRTRRDHAGREYLGVVSPVRVLSDPDGDERPAPLHGEHTDEILLESGYTWDELLQLKIDGAVL
jgi:crotonobetainyl-CoA:carnitine CoA-transferase CaiB-like acyl-CoA transferase